MDCIPHGLYSTRTVSHMDCIPHGLYSTRTVFHMYFTRPSATPVASVRVSASRLHRAAGRHLRCLSRRVTAPIFHSFTASGATPVFPHALPAGLRGAGPAGRLPSRRPRLGRRQTLSHRWRSPPPPASDSPPSTPPQRDYAAPVPLAVFPLPDPDFDVSSRSAIVCA